MSQYFLDFFVLDLVLCLILFFVVLSANVDPSLFFVTGTSSMSTSTGVGFSVEDVDYITTV